MIGNIFSRISEKERIEEDSRKEKIEEFVDKLAPELHIGIRDYSPELLFAGDAVEVASELKSRFYSTLLTIAQRKAEQMGESKVTLNHIRRAYEELFK